MIFIQNFLDINECQPNPCQNSGTCIDGIASYNCTCVHGFAGLDCERSRFDIYQTYTSLLNPQHEENFILLFYLDIDDCSPNSCQNDGSCIDGIADFTCNCSDGFAGNTCEISNYF